MNFFFRFCSLMFLTILRLTVYSWRVVPFFPWLWFIFSTLFLFFLCTYIFLLVYILVLQNLWADTRHLVGLKILLCLNNFFSIYLYFFSQDIYRYIWDLTRIFFCSFFRFECCQVLHDIFVICMNYSVTYCTHAYSIIIN